MLDFLCRPLPFTVTAVVNVDRSLNLSNERLGRTALLDGGAGGGDPQFDIDLGASTSIYTIALLATDLVAGDEVWIRASNASDFTGLVYNEMSLPALASPEGASRVHRQFLHHMTTPVSARYWRVMVSPLTAAWRHVGRFVIGKAFEPLEGRDYGWAQRVIDLGENTRTQTALDDTIIRGKVQEFSWTWSGCTRAEAQNAALDLMAYAGNTRDLLWCGDYTASDRHNIIGYGKLADPVVNTNYAEGWYSLDCQLLSRLILAL